MFLNVWMFWTCVKIPTVHSRVLSICYWKGTETHESGACGNMSISHTTQIKHATLYPTHLGCVWVYLRFPWTQREPMFMKSTAHASWNEKKLQQWNKIQNILNLRSRFRFFSITLVTSSILCGNCKEDAKSFQKKKYIQYLGCSAWVESNFAKGNAYIKISISTTMQVITFLCQPEKYST